MNISHARADFAEESMPDVETMYQSHLAASDLQDVTQQILDLAIHLTDAENSSLMLLNGQNDLYILNSRGSGTEFFRTARTHFGEGVSGQVALQGRAVLVNDIATDLRFSCLRRKRYRTGSFIACPITSGGHVVGILNLNDKKNGAPFTPEDFSNARSVSLMAEGALDSYLRNIRHKMKNVDLADLHRRLIEAEFNNREFIARICHDIRTPLNNIKGAVYYLRNSFLPEDNEGSEFYEIIDKEVNFLISYLEEGVKDYQRIQVKLADIEENEKYKKLLE